MTTPPPDQLIAELIPLLRTAARRPPDAPWLHLATDRDAELVPAIRWMLTDQDSPLAREPAHGRRAVVEWATPAGAWTTRTASEPVLVPEGRIGRIRLRTPRPSTRKA